jgi:aminomethyltransferase
MPNASNTDRVLAALGGTDVTASRAVLAVQGPNSVTRLATIVPEVASMRRFSVRSATWSGFELVMATTGYTGELGFELYFDQAKAADVWHAVMASGQVTPAGLGCRDSLRLEAGMCLYGQDLDPQTTPVEASLNWAIQKVRRTGGARAGGFLGAARVLAQLDQGAQRLRVGLVGLERVPVREHTELQNMQGEHIGEITSGLLSPSLNQPIALGSVQAEYAAIGTPVQALVRGKAVPMEVRPLPFVPNRYHRG